MLDESENPDTRIPAMFQGPLGGVRRKWRALVRAGLTQDNFKSLLEGIELVPVDSLEGRLILTEQPAWPIPGDIQFGQIFAEIREVCKQGLDLTDGNDRDKWYSRMRQFLFDGIDKFWFSLGLFACPQGMGFFPGTKAADANAARDAREILPGLLRWWPQMQQLDPRIVGSVTRLRYWPRWGFNAVHLCGKLRITDDEYRAIFKQDSTAAAETMRIWLKERS